MDNQQQQQGQRPTYADSGFNQFLERSPQTYLANEELNNLTSPFISQVVNNGIIYDPIAIATQQATSTMNSLMQPISANNIQGGVLASENGNLTIDLNQGTLNYSDGAEDLFNLGGTSNSGTDNSLTANNNEGQPILSSDPTIPTI